MGEPTPLRLSYSSLRTFQTCQRKYYWEYVRRVVPQGRRLPLEFGSAWHVAMSAWFKERSVEQAIAAFNAAYADSPDDQTRTQMTAKRMLSLYAEKYAGDELEIAADEQWLEVPLGPGLYVMRIDKLVRWNGVPAIMEHKTTGGYNGIGSSYLKQYKPNLQLAGYVYGAQQMRGPEYTRALLDISWVGRTEPKTGQRFLRYEEAIEDWELKEFTEVVTDVGMEIASRTGAFAEYSPNWNACTQFGECPYRQVCMAAPSIREGLLAQGYVLKPEREESSADANA